MNKARQLYFGVKKIIDGMMFRSISSFSAEAAFFMTVSIFPFLILVITVTGFLPITTDIIGQIPAEILPDVLKKYAQELLSEAQNIKSGTLIITASLLTSLWSASKGTLAVMRGLDFFRGKTAKRGWLFKRIKACVFTLVFVIIIILSFAFIVIGGRAGSWLLRVLGNEYTSVALLFSYRVLISLVVLTLGFMIIYALLPNRRSSPSEVFYGALFSAVGWICFSFVYSIYVNRSSFTVYGSLAMLVFYMLWLYFCIYIVFIGANLNRYLGENKNKSE
ncbi:MAG: YihY/virulence factor BrkB family protein [Acutalibacteraceae bacterium]